MNKNEFFKRLERALSGLSPKEKKEILYDYEEHFRSGLAEGKAEEEIAASLGNPSSIGKAYKADTILSKARSEKSVANILRAVFAALSLGFFNIIFILGPFLGLIGVLIGLWAAAVAIGLSGVGLLLGLIYSSLARWGFIEYFPTVLGVIFAGIGLTSLGGLLCIGMVYLTKWFYKIILKYIQFNINIVKK